jgi:leucyl-tRNA synthetase
VQLAPEHPLVPVLTANDTDLELQISAMIDEQKVARETGDLGAIEKQGVFLGRYAINPYSGERVPIWVANYVLMEYGTGAIMSVPGHDERDFEFANKYGLEIRQVIPASTLPNRWLCRSISEDGVLVRIPAILTAFAVNEAQSEAAD